MEKENILEFELTIGGFFNKKRNYGLGLQLNISLHLGACAAHENTSDKLKTFLAILQLARKHVEPEKTTYSSSFSVNTVQ